MKTSDSKLIFKEYFGQAKKKDKTDSSEKVDVSMTPAAKYVIREARKHLGKKQAEGDTSTSPSEDELYSLVKFVEEYEGEELTARERTAVVAALSSSLEHYDILNSLIENPEVNDIVVRSYNDISVQANRINIQTDLSFPDQETYKSFIENLLKRAGKSCTTATPVVDTAIDTNVRACVTHESFSPKGSGPMLTLRVARHKDITLDGLVQYELAPREILNYLNTIMCHGKKTVLIAGEVGTGKTTLVKALASKIPEDEAILIIEDTHELVLNRKFVRTLLTREANTEGVGRISPAQAIRTGMRMAMNRVILGEMRDAEAAESFIDVCASGHSGMSTIHSRSARDAISRLELFLARAQGHADSSTIKKQIANALSVIVYLGVDAEDKKRRVLEVLEIGASNDGAIQISPIFSYQKKNGIPSWKRESGISLFDKIFREHSVVMPKNGDLITLDPESLYSSMHH